jgi:hypothetical protein
MSRVARVTEFIGRGAGIYVEEPDIPEGMTCAEWRRRRVEQRGTEVAPRPRPAFKWPAVPALTALPRPALGESGP